MKIDESVSEETEGNLEILEHLLSDTSEQPFWPGAPAFYGTDSRAILISGEITEGLADSIVAQLQELHYQSDTDPIRVYVNSVGGDASAGFAIYDWMRCVTNPIIGIAYGRCSSAGLALFMGADNRIATPRTRFFYHEVISGGSTSSEVENRVAYENYQWYQTVMKDILVERAKISKKNWQKYFHNQTSFYFDVNFALKVGIINSVLVEHEKSIKLERG